MKPQNELKGMLIMSFMLLTCSMFITNQLSAQQVEVEGELKVTQMTVDDTQENLVVHNADGTLGSRSVSSLPTPPPPIDTSRNLASDFELAKHMCECGTNLPPFLVESLLGSGYTVADLLGAGVPFANLPFTCGDTIIDDRDGKTYRTILIGNQCWMKENMNVGSMLSGDMTNNFILEKHCYDNNPVNCVTYGAMYQWGEMMQYQSSEASRGVCPTNWHLPTDDEFKTLEMHLGMSQSQADATGSRGTNQGSQLAGDSILWTDGLLNQNIAFDNSGFVSLPSGRTNGAGSYFELSQSGYYWTSSETGGGEASYRLFSYTQPTVFRNSVLKSVSCSVRCVRD